MHLTVIDSNCINDTSPLLEDRYQRGLMDMPPDLWLFLRPLASHILLTRHEPGTFARCREALDLRFEA